MGAVKLPLIRQQCPIGRNAIQLQQGDNLVPEPIQTAAFLSRDFYNMFKI